MAVFIVLWPDLLTTKLKSVIRHNLGHSNLATCKDLFTKKWLHVRIFDKNVVTCKDWYLYIHMKYSDLPNNCAENLINFW